ncbi:hypothetical protein RBA41_22695 [Massilia sp. CCM 9210]|uniref:hypothetical protein n=1 Tax=Massilia scottii TaxID=3057166 RepID=UPI00279677E1|nr:hypothetical protein [Massilia sp. CCM 9210]MDQ1816110.1 hypothetical protein [Massilia sp. CCM 9210]
MKPVLKLFTSDDVRQANNDLIARKDKVPAGLSPASKRLLRQSSFTPDEINRAFAEARRVVGGI